MKEKFIYSLTIVYCLNVLYIGIRIFTDAYFVKIAPETLKYSSGPMPAILT